MEKHRIIRSRILIHFFERVTAWSYPALFSAWILLVLFFALLYFALSYVHGAHSLSGLAELAPLHRFGNALYFSVVTATTVGYGDILPLGFSKLLSAIESVSAFFVFGTFTAKILSQRSDIILDELHRFIYNTNTQHVRESLYIIRSDFNMIMEEAQTKRALSERSWDMLAVASTEGQRILEEILSFYEHHDGTLMIDVRREKLLLEGLHRTLDRLHQLLRALDAEKIDWRGHEDSRGELTEFLELGRKVLPSWKNLALTSNKKPFDRLFATAKELCAIMEKTRKKRS